MDAIKNLFTTGGISEAGKKFIDELGIAEARLVDTSAVEHIRSEGHAEYLPRANKAVIKHDIEYQSVEIAGIPCLELLPSRGLTKPEKTLLYFFGGGYIYGGAEDDMCISAELCGFTGARVISPEYRLAPEHPFPAAISDGNQVYQEIVRRDDSRQVAVVGESAGGNLALTVVQHARRSMLPMPQKVALLSPWCDLTHWRDQERHGMAFPEDPTLHRNDLDNYAAQYAPTQQLDHPDISPLYGDFDKQFPSTMITTATKDVLLPQAIRLSRRLQQAGVPVDLRIYPGLCHVFECYDEIPEAAESLKAIAEFLF